MKKTKNILLIQNHTIYLNKTPCSFMTQAKLVVMLVMLCIYCYCH